MIKKILKLNVFRPCWLGWTLTIPHHSGWPSGRELGRYKLPVSSSKRATAIKPLADIPLYFGDPYIGLSNLKCSMTRDQPTHQIWNTKFVPWPTSVWKMKETSWIGKLEQNLLYMGFLVIWHQLKQSARIQRENPLKKLPATFFHQVWFHPKNNRWQLMTPKISPKKMTP